MASEIRANKQTNRAGLGTVTYTDTGIIVSGIVTANSFKGDGSQLTGISGVSVANQADNRLITATGTTDALNAETNLTYNGTKLTLTGNSASPVVEFINTSGATNEGDVLKLRASGRGSGIDDTDIFLITNNSDTRTFGVSNAGTVNVTGDIKMSSGKNISSSGIITAASFSGDGSSLSNLPAGAPVGGASTNTVFFENDTAVAVNYQITSGKNAMSAGPIAINAGIAVTVPSGSSWTIV